MEQSIVCRANIALLLTIDTDFIIRNYPPSENLRRAVPVSDEPMLLICGGSRGAVSGQGSPRISFNANRGDHISLRGISDTANAVNAVILYNVKHSGEEKVFRMFHSDYTTVDNAPVLDHQMPQGFPSETQELVYQSWDSKVKSKGTEALTISFAVYVLDDDGENQQLYGYYEWQTDITVQ
jgi:nematocidal protein AidA